MRKKTFAKLVKLKISQKNLCASMVCGWGACTRPSIFVEKTFVNGPKSTKFAKAFFFESFPVYCTICVIMIFISTTGGTKEANSCPPKYTAMIHTMPYVLYYIIQQ